jgi:hypothetical protein
MERQQRWKSIGLAQMQAGFGCGFPSPTLISPQNRDISIAEEAHTSTVTMLLDKDEFHSH